MILVRRVGGAPRRAEQSHRVHRPRHEEHAHEPDDRLDHAELVDAGGQLASGQCRNEPIGDAEERQGDRRGDCQMEVAGNEQCVMHNGVHLVGRVDDAAGAGRDERQHAGERSEEADVRPGHFAEPAEQALGSQCASRLLEGGEQGEGGHERRHDDHERQDDLQKLPEGRDAGLHQLVVEADRNREQQEQDEREAGQCVAEQLAPDNLRNDDIPAHVGRKQPEVDERMAEKPEQRAAQHDIDRVHPAERPGDELQQHLGGDAERGDDPHKHRRDGHEGEQRRHFALVQLFPVAELVKHAEPAHPAAHDDKRKRDVEVGRRLHRCIERIEDGSLVQQDADRAHDRPGGHQPVAEPAEVPADGQQLAAGRLGHAADQEPDDEIRGENKRHQDAVRGQELVITDLRRQLDDTAAHQALQQAGDTAEEQGPEGEQNMGEHEPGILPVNLKLWRSIG